MTNIVITTLKPLENRGVEALAKSIVQGTIDHFGDPKITVLTNELELAKKALPQPQVQFLEDDAFGPANGISAGRAARLRLKRTLRRDILGKKRAVEKALEEADIVFVSGGDVFSSTYRTFERYLWQLEYPIKLGTPVLFFAQSIGIFDTKEEEESFASRGRKCHFTVRETISRDYLTDKLGVAADRVTLTADPAFLLKPSGPDVLERYGLTGSRFVCAACSRGISTFKGISYEDHLAAWTAAGRFLLSVTEKLVLVPHVQPSGKEDENDLMLARDLKKALDDDPRVVVLDDPDLDSQDFKTALAASEFTVAERTHGAIGAMSSGVPTLSVGYSIKAEGVLRQLVEDEAIFSKSLLPVTDFTPSHAEMAVREAWEIRDAFAAELARTLPAVKARSRENFVIAEQLIAKKR